MSTQRHVEIDIRADYNPERAAQCRAHSEVLSCRELSLLPSFLPSFLVRFPIHLSDEGLST